MNDEKGIIVQNLIKRVNGIIFSQASLKNLALERIKALSHLESKEGQKARAQWSLAKGQQEIGIPGRMDVKNLTKGQGRPQIKEDKQGTTRWSPKARDNRGGLNALRPR